MNLHLSHLDTKFLFMSKAEAMSAEAQMRKNVEDVQLTQKSRSGKLKKKEMNKMA